MVYCTVCFESKGFAVQILSQSAYKDPLERTMRKKGPCCVRGYSTTKGRRRERLSPPLPTWQKLFLDSRGMRREPLLFFAKRCQMAFGGGSKGRMSPVYGNKEEKRKEKGPLELEEHFRVDLKRERSLSVQYGRRKYVGKREIFSSKKKER